MSRHFLPALRGIFGEWVYYSCLMNLGDVAERIKFATEIHTSKALSDLIQRKLKDARAEDIAIYLQTNPERFFNTLVVAVYGGDPAWHELDQIKPQVDDFKVSEVSPDAIASLGFLSLTGKERLFALDGQHRLAGIKRAIEGDEAIREDEVSVIFVSHRNNAAGMRRTRALFTTLNKTAKPVNKSETIALDESDVMAITTRRLIETHKKFSDSRILVADTPNLPQGDDSHLTTMQNLYDVLTILFSKVMQKKSIKDLSYQRPSDAELDAYYEYAVSYFRMLSAACPELAAFFDSTTPAEIVQQNRRSEGGSILFRPAGLTMFALLAEVLVKRMDLNDAIALLGNLPRELGAAPYAGLIWDVSSGTINLRRQALVRRVLLYMLGRAGGNVSAIALRADISKATGTETSKVRLPKRVA